MASSAGRAAAAAPCSICAQLAPLEHAAQKWGREEEDTSLPAASAALEPVRDFAPYSSRQRLLLRCPECRTHYLYCSDYEYLVNGSEDEQWLQRLTPEEAAALLADGGAAPAPPG
jgi:hypothetical protein